MITENTRGAGDDWVAGVQQALAPYLHRVRYGNLRFEHSRWETADGTLENLAIVYEVPGGSTNQLNISYSHWIPLFAFLPLDASEEVQTASLATVLQQVVENVERIPAIRHRSLVGDIDRWTAQGFSHRDLFQQIKALLQMEDMAGGAITLQEMKAGIAYILTKPPC